jgi:hypothetical protein
VTVCCLVMNTLLWVCKCLGLGGQRETKACDARRVVSSPRGAVMRFNDGAADANPMPVPWGLVVKKVSKI